MIIRTVALPITLSVSKWQEVKRIRDIFSNLLECELVVSADVKETINLCKNIKGTVDIDPYHMSGFMMTGIHLSVGNTDEFKTVDTDEFLSASFRQLFPHENLYLLNYSISG